MTTGITDALTRIQDIQSRIAALAPAPAVSSRSFAAAMTAATAATGSSQVGGATAADASTPTWDGGTPAGDASTDRIVATAKKYLGVPYVWGGTDPAKGLDCSGFVQRVYSDLGVDVPRVSRDQARAGRPVASMADARPGDLVAFGSPVDHIGIYIGDGKMIAAPYPGKQVRIEPVPGTPSAIRRIVDAPAPQPRAISGTPGSVQQVMAAATDRYDLPAGLLPAVAKAESGFNPRAVSPAGAQGLMQLMPATARSLGVDPMQPAQAIDGAARLLRSHLDDFGSVPLALAAYNAGPGAVRRYDGIPPYAETQTYVRRVQAYQKELA